MLFLLPRPPQTDCSSRKYALTGDLTVAGRQQLPEGDHRGERSVAARSGPHDGRNRRQPGALAPHAPPCSLLPLRPATQAPRRASRKSDLDSCPPPRRQTTPPGGTAGAASSRWGATMRSSRTLSAWRRGTRRTTSSGERGVPSWRETFLSPLSDLATAPASSPLTRSVPCHLQGAQAPSSDAHRRQVRPPRAGARRPALVADCPVL